MTPLIVLAVALTGCGDTAESADTEVIDNSDDREVLVLRIDDGSDPATAADAVRTWVDGLGLVDVAVQTTDDGVAVLVPHEHASLVRASFEDPPEVEFRPVLWTAPLAAHADAVGEPSEGEYVEGTDGSGYRLGPAAVTAAGVESANVVPGDNGWSINLVLAEADDGIEGLNSLAARCFAGTAECPPLTETGRGLLAIVIDGAVVVAPSINVPAFERDEVQISTGLAEPELRHLAAGLTAGPPPDEVALG